MEYILIHTDAQGATHLSEKTWETHDGMFTPPSPAGYTITDTMHSNGVLMMHHPAGYRDAWHCAPAPVLGTVLSGNVRIAASGGQHRVLEPGMQFVAADLTGAGHKMEEILLRPYSLVLVVLDERDEILAGYIGE
ncbi:MAG: hypothetical protein KTR35_13400 [Gammaproteobacteria bacterium]|nr:hypothetical protein [Gammaproteobacteria bacterium]